MLRSVRLPLIAMLIATTVGAQTAALAQSPTPVGVWLHANKRIQVEIAPCGDQLCGKIVWFKWPNDAQGLPLVDVENPNPALRTRPLLGLTTLWGLRHTGENTWEDGTIYNPDDGTEYQVRMSIEDDASLHVRVYVLLTIFGETLTWTRVR